MIQKILNSQDRLSLSFHQTFIPERHYLVKLMDYAVDGKVGDLREISNLTGIPTGNTSGKVEPLIRYSEGMGLVKASKDKGKRWRLSVTPLGGQVRNNDPYISETLSQWLLHIRLCRPNGGAEVWYRVFTEGRLALGGSFSKDALKQYLVNCYGDRSSLPGPIVRMYNDSASFDKCAALVEKDGVITFRPMPNQQSYFPGLSALLMLGWEELFGNQMQIGLDEFESRSNFFTILGWSNEDIHYFLDWLVDQGRIVRDSRAGGTVLLRTENTDTTLEHIYDGLV